jgi:hypothetical protein
MLDTINLAKPGYGKSKQLKRVYTDFSSCDKNKAITLLT